MVILQHFLKDFRLKSRATQNFYEESGNFTSGQKISFGNFTPGQGVISAFQRHLPVCSKTKYHPRVLRLEKSPTILQECRSSEFFFDKCMKDQSSLPGITDLVIGF